MRKRNKTQPVAATSPQDVTRQELTFTQLLAVDITRAVVEYVLVDQLDADISLPSPVLKWRDINLDVTRVERKAVSVKVLANLYDSTITQVVMTISLGPDSSSLSSLTVDLHWARQLGQRKWNLFAHLEPNGSIRIIDPAQVPAPIG